MNREPSGRHTNDETAWLAVRYVLDELSPDDAAGFETRLETDQTARDALVQATRLVAAIHATEPAHVPSATSPNVAGRRAWRSLAIAATAALVLVGIVSLPERQGRRNDEPLSAAGEADPARLVTFWSDAAGMLGGAGESSLDDVALAETDSEPNSVAVPPDWMLAAVEHEAWPLPGDLDGDDSVEPN